MDALKQRRTPMRAGFTRVANALEEVLGARTFDLDTVASQLAQLEDKGAKLFEVDSECFTLLQQDKVSQEVFNSEYEAAEVYSDRLIVMKSRATRLLERVDSRSQNGTTSNGNVVRRKYKLPEIELKKFSGDISDWLGFWGQFQKIDLDVDIDPEDKYQYLIQATVKGSRARELAESFPPTAENYPKAIECFKGRFGRKDILVEVYIRALLRLVLVNASNTKQEKLAPLYDKLEAQLNALESLGVATDMYATMLYPLVESCLPEEILRAWERNKGFREENTRDSGQESRLKFLMKFLRNEVESEERISLARSGITMGTKSKGPTSKTGQEYSANIPTAAGLFNGQGQEKIQSCVFCDKPHSSHNCRSALELPKAEKLKLLAKKRCCFGCLKPGHVFRKCRNKPKCNNCGKSHFPIMCIEGKDSQHDKTIEHKRDERQVDKDYTLTNQTCMSEVSLQTLRVRLRGKNQKRMARVLIDTGSQKSYISEQIMQEMAYDEIGEEHMAHGLFGGQETKQQLHKRCRVYMSNIDNSYHCNFEALSQTVICTDIPMMKSRPLKNELLERGILLTDSEENDTSLANSLKIDILLGADVAGKLFTGKIEKLESGPVAIETYLGWTLIGKIPEEERNAGSSLLVLNLFVRNATLSELWTLDTLGITDPIEKRNQEEVNTEVIRQFRETTKREEDGRYEVQLPWIKGHLPLPSNRDIAEKRLKGTVSKLQSANLMNTYTDILKEWLTTGIVEKVPDLEIKNFGHYLPHRAVVSEKSVTTKVRPVFDASCKTKNSPSLNDCLEKGPNLVTLIPEVLNRFRFRKIGVSADIEKAFLQILVNRKDRDYLRFLWSETGKEDDIAVYRHCRVVFGVSSSPFLLGATISYHLETAPESLRDTAEILKESFYVDNVLTSFNSKEKLEQFIKESEHLLSLGKFCLRGWKHTSENDDESIPLLGLLWNPKEDTLSCDLKSVELTESPVTKREILSAASKIFDPVGFACPVLLSAKLMLQDCWKLETPWDTELPSPIADKFRKWRRSLEGLREVKIPRWLQGGTYPEENYSIHVFCDASKVAYAASVYLRTVEPNAVSCHLVQANARVAPLKETTIPRLELMACCIGARLAYNVKQDLHLETIKTYYWTDSNNVLYWIKNNEAWSVFVTNRVKEIRNLTSQEDWHFVPGRVNPADLPSRGCTVKYLLESKWWEGPAWLKLAEIESLSNPIVHDQDVVNMERKKATISSVNFTGELPWYSTRISSYLKIIKVIAWIKRFCSNAQKKSSARKFEIITTDEVEEAEQVLLRCVQKDVFSDKNDPRIRQLRPVEDEKGLLRAQTRIIMRQDTRAFRNPVILPPEHPVVIRIIEQKHKELGHAGVQTLMCCLREDFWIIKGRQTIRKVVKACVVCRRFSGKPPEIPVAPLPEDRIKDAAVFQIVGVDLTGPLILKGGEKNWVALFTCAVFRVIHLELVNSLSTESLLLALRRFIARRGRPSVIYSDNGTNMVGANNEFERVDWQSINSQMNIQRIQWKFNPPSAPWWGGWFERLVGITKQTLRRVLGRTSLKSDELSTILYECESIINSRPLTYVSEETDDLVPLTPVMFLQDIRETRVPELDIIDSRSLNKRYRYRQNLKESLRRRFRQEYLGQLKTPPGPVAERNSLKIGDIVLVENENKKRIDWPLARVLEVYPGRDSKVRVARVQTKSSELLSPIQRLYPLEVTENERKEMGKPLKTSTESQTTRESKEQEEKGKFKKSQPFITRSGRETKIPERFTTG